MSPPRHTPARHILIAVIALCALVLSACDRADPVYNTRFLAFGTLTDISIIGVTRKRAELVSAIVEEDFETMHKAWHAWNPGPLAYLNDSLAQGKSFVAPPAVLPLLEQSRRLAIASDHLFNPAIGQLIKLWGFQSDNPQCSQPPENEKIQTLVKANPRITDIEINGLLMRSLNPSVKLDFGAIGKGYGIDLAINRLKELGIENAIVNSGGDLRAIGSRDGQPWRIAIRSPTGGGVFGFVEVVGDESVFTSGDYERNYQWKGELYHHIIDPRTGYPAKGTSSITVIHGDATTADAAATALFVAGPDHWPEIAAKMGIRHVLLIDAEGVVHMTPDMEKRIHMLKQDHSVKITPIPS